MKSTPIPTVPAEEPLDVDCNDPVIAVILLIGRPPDEVDSPEAEIGADRNTGNPPEELDCPVRFDHCILVIVP
jgi:hypothetical protein